MPLPHAALAAHRHLVYGYALRLLGDASDASDVTQEVLIRFWRQGEGIEPERRTAWVLRLTRNACLDALRARQTRRAYTPNDALAVDAAPCNGESPHTLTEAADFKRRLERALDRLDEPYRSIIILREIHALPYTDIAEMLDLPLNTLKVYLHRARRSLREALRAAVPAEDLLP
jgi:RNA polymerase sigma factor (sigma-70 family)